MGLDRKGRPTLLLLGARLAKHLTPAKRDRLLLHLLMQAEPLASASGDQGFALLLLHADFHWDMDVAWLQEARRRMGADAPTLARKLGAFYVLRPTQWLRSLVGMARTMLKVSLTLTLTLTLTSNLTLTLPLPLPLPQPQPLPPTLTRCPHRHDGRRLPRRASLAG